MKDRNTHVNQLLIRYLLVLLPTTLIGYLTLRFVNLSYTALNTSVLSQSLYFGLGLLIAYTLYYFRARIIVTFLLLWFAYWLIDNAIKKLPGEFDVFYATARFQLYATLFIIGWIFGFLLAYIRWAYIIIFGLIFTVTLVSVSATVDISLSYILLHLAPSVGYGLYMMFLSPHLKEYIVLTGKQVGRLSLRIVMLALVILLVLVITERLFRSELKAVETELAARGAKEDKDKEKGGEGGYDERHGLMEKEDDGYRLKDTMRVTSRMSQSDKLMFCSKLDNFFDDGSPAPLYFVFHYLTRYDPAKETFTRDVNVPSLDEIDVDPMSLPMYYSYADTSIIRKSQASKLRKVVEAQVYLSENTWKHSVLGPSSVFALQTIPVERDFQKTFFSAYKIFAYSSDLNNAYFVYNISANPMLEPLQDQRHDELRSIRNYNSVDQEFLKYYTEVPEGGIYDSIANLARSLVPPNAKPVDKVLAVRDFFLKRNENGKRIFRYTLKAGAVDDPNIPSSKMLYDFLFKTHAGYCTYYAGASHFMLRALGIPTRFTTGFAAVDRSDKNKGWYWFYASQAHAWTQVYFPEYGWLDFDMTIGNEDQQGAPKPDGTPPLPPPDPWLVLNAKTVTVDSVSKSLTASFSQLIYFDKPYDLKNSTEKKIDASLCRVLYDKRDTTFNAIQEGDSIIVVSYKDEAKVIPKPRAGVRIEEQIEAFPSPIVADEIHIRPKQKEKKKEETGGKAVAEEEKKMTWEEIAWLAATVTGGIIILLFLLPALYLMYRIVLMSFTRDPQRKADQVYRASLYRFHMAGIERDMETPLEYATTKVDPQLGTGFEDFMRVYLRLKYANASLRPEDSRMIDDFAGTVGPSIRRRKGFFRTFFRYFNLLLALRYFQQPEKTDHETPST
jgi:protein-glutamine gamma-glutamyltransferase